MRDDLIDTLKVIVPNGTVLGVVTFSQLETGLKIVLLMISISYTLWKWNHDLHTKG